jgi:hypothetical protein
LGEDWNQKKISLLEAKEEIDSGLLEHIAKTLNVPIEAIKNFDDEGAINIISNTFHDFKDNAIASAMNYQCNFNPFDKVVQLYDEKIALYERMLKDKNEMIEKLEKIIADKK